MHNHLASLDRRWLAHMERVAFDGQQAGTYTVPDPGTSSERIMALLDGYGVQLVRAGSARARRAASWPPARWGRSWASRSAPADRHWAGGVSGGGSALAPASMERFVPV